MRNTFCKQMKKLLQNEIKPQTFEVDDAIRIEYEKYDGLYDVYNKTTGKTKRGYFFEVSKFVSESIKNHKKNQEKL